VTEYNLTCCKWTKKTTNTKWYKLNAEL